MANIDTTQGRAERHGKRTVETCPPGGPYCKCGRSLFRLPIIQTSPLHSVASQPCCQCKVMNAMLCLCLCQCQCSCMHEIRIHTAALDKYSFLSHSLRLRLSSSSGWAQQPGPPSPPSASTTACAPWAIRYRSTPRSPGWRSRCAASAARLLARTPSRTLPPSRVCSH